ncbi:hypothetical protein [Reichenbachiella sp.]
MKIRKEKIYDVLFKAIIVIAIFDGVRHNSILFSFSFIKELSIFILLSMLLIEKKFKIHNPTNNIEFTPILLYLFTVGTLVTIGNADLATREAISPIGLHVKTLEFFTIIYLFSFYTYLTNKKFEHLVLFFINVNIIYILFSVLSYFVHFPFITEFRPYSGRISSGYPTSDSQSISFAFILLLFSRGEIPKYKLKFIILSFGILMQATTTGIATYTFISGIYFVFGKFLSGKKGLKKNLASLSYIGLAITFLFLSVVVYIDDETLERFYLMITSKSEFIVYYLKLKLTGVESQTSDQLVTGTYEVRGRAVEQVMSVYNSPLDLTFGRGTALASIVENQYSFFIRAYGYLGLILYFLFLFGLLIRAINKSTLSFWFMAISASILLLSNFSQITSYLFQIAIAFSIVTNYCLQLEKTHLVSKDKVEYEQ